MVNFFLNLTIGGSVIVNTFTEREDLNNPEPLQIDCSEAKFHQLLCTSPCIV